MAQAIGQGDQYAMGAAYNAGMTSLSAFMTQDPTTGGPLGRTGLPGGAQYMPLRVQFNRNLNTAFNQMGMSNDVKKATMPFFEPGGGGTLAMEGEIFNLSRQAAQVSAGHQIASARIRMGFQMGGATGVDSQGFAIGGDLSALANMVNRQGFSFNAGNGMGIWQIEDAQTRLKREQQDYGLMNQGLQLQYQGQDRALQISQFNEKWDANYSWFQRNTRQQRWSMNFGRNMQLQQREWQYEDLSMNQAQADTQFGWGQEDYARNIRYARGRERLDLIRQQNRAVISYSMEQTQRERQGDRLDQSSEWEDKRFKKEEKFFEASVKHQDDMMKMEKRHFEERMKLADKLFEIQLDAFEKQKDWINEERKLEDQSRLLSRQQFQVLETMGIRASGAIAGINDRIKLLEGGLKGVATSGENIQISLGKAIASGELFSIAMGAVISSAIPLKDAMVTVVTDMQKAMLHAQKIAEAINKIKLPAPGSKADYTTKTSTARDLSGSDYSKQFEIMIRLLKLIAGKGGNVSANIFTSSKNVTIAELERSVRMHVAR
jgi:hypothetical protein